MLNLFTRVNNKVEKIMGKTGGHKAPLFIFFFLFISILGFLPGKEIYVAKIFLFQWFMVGTVAIFYVKNIWLKGFVFWAVIRMIIGYRGIENLAIFTLFSIVFACLFFQFIKDRISKKDFLDILCVIAITQVSWVYIQLVGLDYLFKVAKLYLECKNLNVGFMGNTNLSGILLAICIPAFFRKKWLFFLPVFIYPFIKINCYTSFLALGAGVGFYAYKRLNSLFAITLIMVLLYAIVFIFGFHKIVGTNPRFDLWRRVVKIGMVHPIIGAGLGQYRFVAKPFISSKLKTSLNGTTAHNDYLQIWIDAGIIAVTLIFGFILWHFIKFSNADPRLLTISFIGIISACGFFIFYTPVGLIVLASMAVTEKGES